MTWKYTDASHTWAVFTAPDGSITTTAVGNLPAGTQIAEYTDLAGAIAALQEKLATAGTTALCSPVTISALGGLVNSFAPQWLGLINGAFAAAQANSAFVAQWEAQNGWYQLTAAQIIMLWQTGMTYVQAIFANQKTHAMNIAALTTMAQVLAYDVTTGWPSTSV